MTRRELTTLMERQFGPNWRDKAIVGPCGGFALRDVYQEMGWHPSVPSSSFGLWQTIDDA